MTRSVIDPITRIEGHLRVEMEVSNGRVSDAWVSGGCFRGMELVVQDRTPEDAAQIVERICGVCPVSHAHASSIAGEKAYGITISNNARLIRNLLEGAQFLHSHISSACLLLVGSGSPAHTGSTFHHLPEFCSTIVATLFLKWAFKVLNDMELLSDKYLKSSCLTAVKSYCSF